MVSFLSDINQYTNMGDNRSFTRVINRSIVQGSCISPTLLIIFSSKLRPVGLANSLTKYANDTSLLVPEKTDVEMFEEFNNKSKWSADNKLKVNLKTRRDSVS